MLDIADSIDRLVEVLTNGISGDGSYLAFLVVAFILGLIFWKGGIVLKSIGFSVALVYGLTLASSCEIYSAMWVAGVAVALIGLGLLYEIVTGILKKKSKVSPKGE